MDISDGLIADLGHICQQSGLAAEIQWSQVPLSAAARAALGLKPDLQAKILGGGDDYELLFTVADHDAARAMEIAAAAGVPVAVIGTLVSGAGVAVRAEDGSAIAVAHRGFQHF